MVHKHVTSLDAEIAARMESDAWDAMIARTVIAARKKRMQKRFIAAAIMLVISSATLLLIAPGTQKNASATLESLIAEQVNGTYRSVFLDSFDTANGYARPLGEIDYVVDAALAKR
jgi:hypothetical protein